MSKDQWIADHERALIDYESDGDFEAFFSACRDLGLDKHEIFRQAADIDKDRENAPTDNFAR